MYDVLMKMHIQLGHDNNEDHNVGFSHVYENIMLWFNLLHLNLNDTYFICFLCNNFSQSRIKNVLKSKNPLSYIALSHGGLRKT
jgi:hypothetical protein